MTEPSPRPPAARPPPPPLRPALVTVFSAVAVLVLGAGVAVWWHAPVGPHAAAPPGAVAVQPAADHPAAPAKLPRAAPAPNAAVPPSFDVVRIEPGGHAVIAGRAAPDAVVAVRADGRDLGRAHADSAGNWLLLPNRPLPPGPARLTLSATLPGGAVLPGSAALHLTVPAAPAAIPSTAQAGPSGPAAGGGGAPPATVAASIPAAPGPVGLGAGPAGRVLAGTRAVARGTAPPRTALATTAANAGRGPARASGPRRPAGARLSVRPGQSLWRIARLHYGKGKDYPTIYQANRAEIANPNLIFPGQTFALPPKPRHPPQPPARGAAR